MPDRRLLDEVKPILKRAPGVKWLNSIRHQIIQIRELSDLLKANRLVVFCPYSRMQDEVALTRAMVQEVMREWLDLYGVIHLRRATSAAIDAPARAVLLYVPQAFLRIPSTHEQYLGIVRKETRKDVRLSAQNGYECKEFVWNDHLDEIYEINTSKEVRQSIPMRGWYREPVQPRNRCKEELIYQKYYGAFKDGKLLAYLHYWICGEFAIGKHFIGHSQHLKYGIMNGLMSYTVGECVKNSQIRWLYYGAYIEGSLNSFKKHAGFQGYAVLLDLEREPDLLQYSEQKVRTIWPL